jgi:hypothetical protein
VVFPASGRGIAGAEDCSAALPEANDLYQDKPRIACPDSIEYYCPRVGPGHHPPVDSVERLDYVLWHLKKVPLGVDVTTVIRHCQ